MAEPSCICVYKLFSQFSNLEFVSIKDFGTQSELTKT
jgi:hypothetical protein